MAASPMEVTALDDNTAPSTRDIAMIPSIPSELTVDGRPVARPPGRLRQRRKLPVSPVEVVKPMAKRTRQPFRRCVRLEAEVKKLRAELAESRNALASAQEKLAQADARWKIIRVSSPITDVQHWERLPKSGDLSEYRWWPSWCPCCKRPLDVTVFCDIEKASKPKPSVQCAQVQNVPQQIALPVQNVPRQIDLPAYSAPPLQSRFAYATSLWGTDPGFVLGALVLGRALRRSGTQHDLVLMHTDDVPNSARTILSHVWSLKGVDFIDADSGLFSAKGGRFDGVFTKLHALGLTEYEKVLMLDIDLAILKCPDELFEMYAPAALMRGRSDAEHGSRIDGRNFFAGDKGIDDLNFAWCQHGGINAGVMLLEPDAALHNRALREVTGKYHPERIPGNGPEQDYLTRLFAPWWRHLSVAFNYQLHHVFFALESALTSQEFYNEPYQPTRLALDVADISVIHFSGELKMWDRNYAAGETDQDFVRRLLQDCSPYGMRLWVDGEGDDDEYAQFGVRRCADKGCWASRREGGEFDESVNRIIQKGVEQVHIAAMRAAAQWKADVESLAGACAGMPALPELMEQLRNPSWPANAAFSRNERVEVYWKRTGQWYVGTVVAAHVDGTLSVDFDVPGFWGSGCRSIAPWRLRRLEASSAPVDT